MIHNHAHICSNILKKRLWSESTGRKVIREVLCQLEDLPDFRKGESPRLNPAAECRGEDPDAKMADQGEKLSERTACQEKTAGKQKKYVVRKCLKIKGLRCFHNLSQNPATDGRR